MADSARVKIDKLCSILRLGEITVEPAPISGGFLHRMYCIVTTKGKYAVKALNPQIMNRTTAMQNYIKSENIANIAARRIPALPAKRANRTFIHEIDGQYFLVFDWIDGINLKPEEINLNHSVKVGKILADIHMTDFSELGLINVSSNHKEPTDWSFYLGKGHVLGAIWADQYAAVMDQLYDWQEKAYKAENLLASHFVISHRDLDPKNVMWNQGNPIIIDWESAGFTNPMKDLVETALYWSEGGSQGVNHERFLAFIEAYTSRFGMVQADWRMVLASGFLSKMGWLEYNLKRSLGIECIDMEEQQVGTAQVIETIHALKGYAERIPVIERLLCTSFHNKECIHE